MVAQTVSGYSFPSLQDAFISRWPSNPNPQASYIWILQPPNNFLYFPLASNKLNHQRAYIFSSYPFEFSFTCKRGCIVLCISLYGIGIFERGGFFFSKRRIIISPILRPGCCHAQFALASDRTSDSWVQLYMKSFRKRTMGCFERLGSFRQGFRRIGAALTRSRQSNRPLNIVSDASLYSKQGHIQG